MVLYLDANTKISDLMIEYIEVRLRDGEEVVIRWEDEDILRKKNGFEAKYKNIYFEDEDVDIELSNLEDMEIIGMQTYSENGEYESDEMDDKTLKITGIEFNDDGEYLTIL